MLVLIYDRTLLSTLFAAGLLLLVPARARAAGSDPESGASSTTTGDRTAAPVEPIETTTVQAPPPVEPAPPTPIPEIDEQTAYMVGKHTLKLGTLACEYGILQQLSIGTAPPRVDLAVDHQCPGPHPGAGAEGHLPGAAPGHLQRLGRRRQSGRLFDFELSKSQVKFRIPVASGGDAIVTVGTTLGI